jgi:hypothetical protein
MQKAKTSMFNRTLCRKFIVPGLLKELAILSNVDFLEGKVMVDDGAGVKCIST